LEGGNDILTYGEKGEWGKKVGNRYASYLGLCHINLIKLQLVKGNEISLWPTRYGALLAVMVNFVTVRL